MGLVLAPTEIRMNVAFLRSYLGTVTECYKNVYERVQEYYDDEDLDTESWTGSKYKMEICYRLIAEGMISAQESITADIETLLGCIGDEYLDEDELNSQIEKLQMQCQAYEETIAEWQAVSSDFLEAGYSGVVGGLVENYRDMIENLKEQIAVLKEKLIFLHEAEDLTVNLFQSAVDLLTAVQNAISDGGVNVTTDSGFPQQPEWLTVLANGIDTEELKAVEADDINNLEEIDDFESYLIEQGFPEGYVQYLMILHAEYPEWKFEAVITGIDHAEFVTYQLDNEFKCADIDENPKYCGQFAFTNEKSAKYYVANEDAVRFFTNPYSLLQLNGKKYTNAMQFLKADQQLPKAYIEEVVPAILQNEDQTIIDAIKNANSCVNPVFMASIYASENGPKGDVYQGVSVYNFFNIGANTGKDDACRYAYEHGWTSPEACIAGSEVKFQEYIDKGQDTLYALDWDFIAYADGRAVSQYAALVNDAEDKAINLCVKNGVEFDLHHEFVFKIPVYENIVPFGNEKYGAFPDPNH